MHDKNQMKDKQRFNHPEDVLKKKWPISPPGMWSLIVISVFLLDQLTKWLAMKHLCLGLPKAVFPGFDLELRFNYGAAFSFLADQAGWQRWFFTIIAFVVSIMLFFWLRRLPLKQKMEGIGLSLLLAGALGNLVDRLLFGYVIDFILLYVQKPNWTWPAFNIADSAICVGVFMVMIVLLKKPEK